jgi:phosphate transport system substrate-binding protein
MLAGVEAGMRVCIGLAWWALQGCGGTPPAAEVGELEPRSAIRVVGSETASHALLPALFDSFNSGEKASEFSLVVNTSGEGIRKLLSDETDIVVSSRLPYPAELEQAAALGVDLHAGEANRLLAVDVVAVAVHTDSPLRDLSYDQVIGVFCTESITDWSQLGLAPGPIRPLTRGPMAGNRALFEDFFCGPDGIDTHIEQASSDEIGASLLEDPATISYVSMSEARGRMLSLRSSQDDRPIAPSQQNMLRGAYPLYRDLYIFAREDAGEQVKAFLDHVRSPGGQEVVDETRFVPLFLRPERLDEPRPLREVVHFEKGSDAPTVRSLARLQVLVQDLRDRTSVARHIILEGFTDNRESAPLELGEARARAVKLLLEDRLPGLYFELIPRGASSPLAPNSTPYGRQRNRRVQIYLASEEGFEPITSGENGKASPDGSPARAD